MVKRSWAMWQELRQSKFVRNVMILATGTAAAQAISMLFSPVITRLYGPEAFGMLGAFMALMEVLAPLAAMCYPIAIVLPKDDADAKGIAQLSAYIAVGMTCLVALILWASGDWLINLLKLDEIKDVMVLVPVCVFFSALLQIAQQWLIRKKLFNVTARVAVWQAFIINCARTGVGLVKPVGAALIVLATAGAAIHSLMLAWGAKIAIGKDNDHKKDEPRKPLTKLAKQYYDFPVYRAPQVFINAISQGLPVLMLSAFFGPASAGFYTLCKTVLGMPSYLIGKSVGDVFYPRIAEAAHQGENLTQIILKATLALAAVGFFPFAVVVAFGPWLFGFVFGAEWVIAGEYARWLALWLFCGFLNQPSVMAIAVLSLQGLFLIFEILSVSARASILLVGFYVFKSDLITVCLFSLIGVILNLLLIGLTLLKSQKLMKAVKQ